MKNLANLAILVSLCCFALGCADTTTTAPPATPTTEIDSETDMTTTDLGTETDTEIDTTTTE
jgi:hypothetical protein